MAYQIFAAWRSSSLTWYDIYNPSDSNVILQSDTFVYSDNGGVNGGYNSAVYINSPDSAVSNFSFFLIFDANTTVSWYAGGSHTNTTHDNGNNLFGVLAGSNGTARSVVDITHIDGLPVFRDYQEYLTYISTPAQPPYNWQSVPSISGKNGILPLAQIDSEQIEPWNTQKSITGDSSYFTLPAKCKMINFLQNLADGVETTVIYCGDNYATLTRSTSISPTGFTQISGTLKLYLKTGIEVFTRNIFGYSVQTSGALASVENEYLGFIIDAENQVANLDSVLVAEDSQSGTTQYIWNPYGDTGDTDLFEIYVWLQGSTFPDEKDPYEEGTTDNGGVDGYVTPQDSLPPNLLPSVDGINTGMFTVWLPDDNDIIHISSFLWSNDVVENIEKYFNNVGECVLGLYILPYIPSSGVGSKKFKIGNLTDSDYRNVSYLTSRYREEDMGSFDLSSIWDSYLDFAPYTKLEIFLPYCGLHQLDVDELMCPADKDGTLGNKTGSTMTCLYRLDLLTGAVVVYLLMNGEVRYQFSGKMGANLPVTGNDYGTMIQTLIQGVSGLANTVVNHAISAPYAQNPVAPTAPPSDASKGVVRQYNKDLRDYKDFQESKARKLGHSAGNATGAAISGTIASMKPDVIRCGNISGDNSMMGYDRPYLIKTRPNKPLLEGQGKFTGFPCYRSGKVGDFSGYTECLKVHLTDIPCTANEQKEIENWLTNGVIIKEGSETPDVTPTVEGNLVIVLLNMIDEVNVIGKSWTDSKKIEGKLLYDQSVSSPIILIDGDCIGYNYAYVPFFNRYYFISDYVVTREYLQELHLMCDPLQSFVEQIENAECIVTRSQSNPNYYMNDGVFYTEQRMVVTYHCFKKDGDIRKFDTQQLYLITAGG